LQQTHQINPHMVVVARLRFRGLNKQAEGCNSTPHVLAVELTTHGDTE
jgi:hypothetical protein